MIARSERILREGVLDALNLTSVPDDGMDHSACSHPGCRVARRLRDAITKARESPDEHPEDFCEACREPFEPWHAPTDDWEAATGRRWGGPIVCQTCFALMLERRQISVGTWQSERDGEAPEPQGSEAGGSARLPVLTDWRRKHVLAACWSLRRAGFTVPMLDDNDPLPEAIVVSLPVRPNLERCVFDIRLPGAGQR